MTNVASNDGSLGRCGHVGVAGQHYFNLSHRTPPCSYFRFRKSARDLALSNVPHNLDGRARKTRPDIAAQLAQDLSGPHLRG
ncbi:MAG: hypothetical protein M3526_03340, partial [Actinomycetota bacterium]|nr:hypothetical protein [Actinomycetota bacterium]